MNNCRNNNLPAPIWSVYDMAADMFDGGAFDSKEEALDLIKSSFEGSAIDIMKARMDANTFVDVVVEQIYGQ